MIKIMIADDDFLVRSNVKLMLKELTGSDKRNHFEVVAEAGDGAEAVRLLGSVVPDIIISDIQMPKTNGIELQRYANQNLPSIKFIMLSNYDDYDYVREALKNGAVDYILKHKLSVDLLDTTINRAIEMIKDNTNQKLSKELTKGFSLVALKRDFILSLIAGFYLQLDEIKSRISVLGLPIAVTNLLTVIMTVQHENIISNSLLRTSSYHSCSIKSEAVIVIPKDTLLPLKP
jgi:two-component system response regulator YesN